LEDEKELEDDLKTEKESIEKKVEERTKALSIAKDEISKGWMQLQREKLLLTSSISSLTLGFIMTDRENNIIVINQSARNILCQSASSALLTVKECTLTHIEDELKGAIDLRSLINQSVKEKRVIWVKEVEFDKRFLKIVITPILEETEVIGAVVLIEDITEAKILERSKDEFFSIASHELRTPLTAIRGNTSLIEQYYSDELKDKDLKEMIDDIHHSSVRLIEIVNDFLDMSRLELGKIVFKKEPIDLAEVIQSVVKEYQTTGSLKMLYLNFISPLETLPQVIGDKDRVRQVLINLIGNAVKYTEKGGVTISIDKNDGFLEVLVSDTGKGISEENQTLLFRKFQQASDNIYTRDSSQSTGLGLYISRLMAEGMGGKVKLNKSAVNLGSVFSLSLQIYEQKEAKNV
jgi:signal transduction histidine kinase